jgi:hypothetical protein
MKKMSVWMIIIASLMMVACTVTPPLPSSDPRLPLAPQDAPLYDRDGEQVRANPWTADQRGEWIAEERERMQVAYEADWRSWCLILSLIALAPIPLCLGIGLYLRSRWLTLAGPVVCIATVIIVYGAGQAAPAAARWITMASIVMVIALVAAVCVFLARWLRRESVAFSEVVSTTQKTKRLPWDDSARAIALRIQGDYTQRRVQEVKTKIAGHDGLQLKAKSDE